MHEHKDTMHSLSAWKLKKDVKLDYNKIEYWWLSSKAYSTK